MNFQLIEVGRYSPYIGFQYVPIALLNWRNTLLFVWTSSPRCTVLSQSLGIECLYLNSYAPSNFIMSNWDPLKTKGDLRVSLFVIKLIFLSVSPDCIFGKRSFKIERRRLNLSATVIVAIPLSYWFYFHSSSVEKLWKWNSDSEPLLFCCSWFDLAWKWE